MNKVCLIGRLVRDPELRYTQTGIAVTNFTLAVGRVFAKKGEQQADFIPVIVWQKSAENVAKYLKKGSQTAVIGRIQTSSYEDKDGKRVFKVEVIAESVEFLSSNIKKQEESETLKAASEVFDGEIAYMEDEIPF